METNTTLLCLSFLADHDAVNYITSCHSLQEQLQTHYIVKKCVPYSLCESLPYKFNHIEIIDINDLVELKHLKILTFDQSFDQPLTPGVIPLNVRTLRFGTCFNQALTPGVIPDSVRTLTFGYSFNHPLAHGVIPASVHTLRFGYWFNQILAPGVIPASVHTLRFGAWFNQPLIPGVIPSGCKVIKPRDG